MDYSKLTLGELTSHQNQTIRRNAMSILKQLQRNNYYCSNCMDWVVRNERGECPYEQCGQKLN